MHDLDREIPGRQEFSCTAGIACKSSKKPTRAFGGYEE